MKHFNFIEVREIFFQDSLNLTILLVKSTQFGDICSLLEQKETEISITRFSTVEIPPPTHHCLLQKWFLGREWD